MFDTANGTMQSMIEQSPLYMETILRLSDDIGAMADRIGDMADRIVETPDYPKPELPSDSDECPESYRYAFG